MPEEAFTPQEALDSFTTAGAYASFEEHSKGRIQPGMLADFVILENNPLLTEPSTIQHIPVLETYIGGRLVYRKQ